MGQKISKLKALKEELRNEKEAVKIISKKEKIKTVSGYNIMALLKYDSISDIITHLMCGSVGTLGIFTAITLEVKPIPRERVAYLIYFENLIEVGDAVQHIKKLDPSALELMDSNSLGLIKDSSDIDVSDVDALLIIEFDDCSREKLKELKELMKTRNYKLIEDIKVAFTQNEQEELWKVRKGLLPAPSNYSKETEPALTIDDLVVELKHLPFSLFGGMLL